MLTNLGLSNFKGFDETGISIGFGRITVFIGANGSGKSSALQALTLLKQSLGEASLRLDGPILKLGSLKDVIHSGDEALRMRVRLTADYQLDPKRVQLSEPELPARGKVCQELDLIGSNVARSVGRMGDERTHFALGWHLSQDGRPTEATRPLYIRGAQWFQLAGIPQIGIPFATAVTNSPAPERAEREAAGKELSSAVSSIDLALRRFHLVPAIRGFEEMSHGIIQNLVDTLVEPSAGSPQWQAQVVANQLAHEREAEQAVAKVLRRVFGRDDLAIQAHLAKGSVVVVDVVDQHGKRNVVNEAFGLNQLLLPVIWLVSTEPASFIAIEEPENHLHPRAQASLCDMLVEIAVENDKQLVLSTHSEHILMGLLTAVAAGKLAAGDLAVYEFHADVGRCTVQRLEVNDGGQVEGGLRDFLEADVEQMGRLMEARLGRGRP